jgi:hypothetical protein
MKTGATTENNPMSDPTRNIGFLGPAFLGLGLFSDMPAAERESFRRWLDSEKAEHGEEWYKLTDEVWWSLHKLRTARAPK